MMIRILHNSSIIIITIVSSITSNLSAQKRVDVTVSNYEFTPKNIIIDAGDTVNWVNVEGLHNVNGTKEVYQSNPEPFGNIAAIAPWEYSYIFNTPGLYEYHCDPHLNIGMTGEIEVLEKTSIDIDISTNIKKDNIKIYPLPITDKLIIEIPEDFINKNKNINISIYDITGREILRKENLTEATISLDAKKLTNSLYIFHLICGSTIFESRKIIIH